MAVPLARIIPVILALDQWLEALQGEVKMTHVQ